MDASQHPPARVVAFYAYPDGIGRSCMTANMALILASWGYRVLVVDCDLATPALYRYLSAFLPEDDSRLGTSPVRLACQFAGAQGFVDFLGPVSDNVVDSTAFSAQRADLVDSAYDFVLVDIPAGADSVQLTRDVADILVLGYNLDQQAMDKADQHARAIRRGGRGEGIQILPVPMKVDERAGGATARMVSKGRRRFAWLLADMPEEKQPEYWNAIQIPYEPDYASEEGLPYLDEPSEQRDHLVAAYLRLALQIAPGPARSDQPPATPQTRTRYRAARIAARESPAVVRVVHAAEDRYWAEWLVAELKTIGMNAARWRIDQVSQADTRSTSDLLVVSRHLLPFHGRSDYLTALSTSSPGERSPLSISIDGMELPRRRYLVLAHIDLSGLSAEEAHEQLISFYQAPSVTVSAYSRLHYPGTSGNGISNLPLRDDVFHGRDDDIDMIRDHFMASEGPAHLILTGSPGIGKSHLAQEYAHRFAPYYDLVWRLEAGSQQAVRAALAELAVLAPPMHPGGDAGVSVLRNLAGPDAPGKWLLIYDGAESSAAIEELLPAQGHGHVLMTARTTMSDPATELPVKPLALGAASAMLTDLGTPTSQAEEIATALKGVPLAIRLAAGWIEGVRDLLLDSGITPATAINNAAQELSPVLAPLGGAATGQRDPLEVMTGLLIDLLRTQPSAYGNAALLLLETCAFLAPTGMSRRLLRSPEMLRQLAAADPRLSDPVVVHNVLRTLVRYRFTVHNGVPTESLRIHQRVLELLRARMDEEAREARGQAVSRMLAASAPRDADDDVIGEAAIYAELQPHLAPSGALLRPDDEVRRWLVSQVRFLWQLETMSAWRMARDLGEQLAQRWAAESPAADYDPLLLRLRTQLANVYRSLGEFDHAREIDRDVLVRQRSLLGLRHPRTLMTARSYGADLRLVGDFEAALLEDQSTWQAFSQTLGDDHLMAIIASANLVLSELSYGEPEQALERLHDDLVHSRRIRSERPWQESVLWSRIGALQRQLGWYEKSRESLREAWRQYEDLIGGKVISPIARPVLHTTASLAVTERMLGQPDIDTTRRVLADYQNAYGSLYPDRFSLVLSLAGDLNATGRPSEAVEEATRARAGCAEHFGATHPFTRICEVNLSIYALGADRLEIADEISAQALSSLSEVLAPGHPWLQAAAVARANVLAETGRAEEALRLQRPALGEYRSRLGTANRLTKIIAVNMTIIRNLLDEPAVMPDSVGRSRRWETIELDIPPY